MFLANIDDQKLQKLMS